MILFVAAAGTCCWAPRGQRRRAYGRRDTAGRAARDFRALPDDVELRANAILAEEAQLRDLFEQAAAEAHTLGAGWLVFPWIP